MKIEVNGEPIEVSSTATLRQLLAALEQDVAGAAVAVNADIVPQHAWDDYLLQERDKVSLFRAIAGG